MLPASNRGVGMSLNFPDVCKTPAPPAPFVPIPYPDIGLNMQAAPFSPFVSIAFMPATNMGTLKVMTSGDEAGAMGGLVTGMIKGPGKTTVGNPLVFVTGLPAESLLNPTSGNMMNAPVGAQIVPSVVNVLYTYRDGEPDAGVLGADAIRALGDVARGEGGANEASRVGCRWAAPGVAHLRIALFTTGTDREVWNALRALGDVELRGIVVDVRGNPGGDTGAAIRLAAACLPPGTAMLLQREAGDEEGDEEVVTSRGAQTHHAPMCVLVDGGTASAAELFAAALQHAGRATVVGTATFGKATGQRVVVGADGEARYATTTTFSLPDRRPLDGHGVTPDVVLPRTDGAPPDDVDPRLLAAVSIAKQGRRGG